MTFLTIGTSNRSEAEFFHQLVVRRVVTLVDVRSKPWSRIPHFRRPALTKSAPMHGIRYLWEGELLGGLNEIRTDDPAFLAALDGLLALQGDGRVAIFCAEGEAAECHRSAKVGAALLVHRGVDATNILRNGIEEPVSRTLVRTKPENIPACVRDEALRLALKRASAS